MQAEDIRTERHEFHRGEMFAMVGARRSHGTVAGQWVRDPGQRLKGSPYRAFRRKADGQWTLHDMTDAALLALPCIEAELPMAEVFDGVEPAA